MKEANSLEEIKKIRKVNGTIMFACFGLFVVCILATMITSDIEYAIAAVIVCILLCAFGLEVRYWDTKYHMTRLIKELKNEK